MQIKGLKNAKADVRYAVRLAVQYWPNAHLGAVSPRQDIRSAFEFIRNPLNAGECIQAAAGQLMFDALRHEDM